MSHARSRSLIHSGVLAVAVLGSSMLAPSLPAGAQEKSSPTNTPHSSAITLTSPTLAVPSPEALLLLVRTTMIAIDQANKTGDYSVLRAIAGPGLQAYSVHQLAKTFEPLRTNKIDLAPAAVVTPELGERPVISSEGLLTLAGSFPTRPMQIQFRFVYQADHGSWKSFGLSVSMISVDAPEPPLPRRARRSP